MKSLIHMIGKYEDINEALTALIIGITAFSLAPITIMFTLSVISSDNNLEINSGPIPEGSPNSTAILILLWGIFFSYSL